MQVFFVISGAVITMTLLRSRSPIDFAVRRFARLYPAYLVCMTFTCLFVAVFGPGFLKVSLLDYAANLTMLANRLGAEFVDGSYWSLVVEIEFYFYVAVALRRNGRDLIADGAAASARATARRAAPL